jgi:hypothetical protein
VLVFLIVAVGVALFVLIFGAVATESARMRLFSILTLAVLVIGGGIAIYLSAAHQQG